MLVSVERWHHPSDPGSHQAGGWLNTQPISQREEREVQLATRPGGQDTLCRRTEH